MATPRLAPCLVQLRAEFNACNPNRDKSSDGWIGDTAHQNSKSDHNPDKRGIVHAIDVDETGPWDGEPFSAKIERLRLRCKSGAEKRITYIIYEGRICSAIDNWRWRDYSGANPHDKHAHISCSYTLSRENNTATFGVRKPAPPPEEDDMPTAQEIAAAVWAHPLRNPYSDVDQPAGTILRYVPSRQGHLDTQAALAALGQALSQTIALLRLELAADEASDAADREAVLAALAAAEARLAAAIEPPDGDPPAEPES